MNTNEIKVYKLLDSINADYSVIEHDRLFTSKDLELVTDKIEGRYCKNLFLRNSKGDRYYLIVLEHTKNVEIQRDIKAQIGSTRLSFASSERLKEVLDLTPGSVNPFALLNNKTAQVEVFFDKELLDGQKLNFHPNNNSKTLTIGLIDLKRAVSEMGYEFNVIAL